MLTLTKKNVEDSHRVTRTRPGDNNKEKRADGPRDAWAALSWVEAAQGHTGHVLKISLFLLQTFRNLSYISKKG